MQIHGLECHDMMEPAAEHMAPMVALCENRKLCDATRMYRVAKAPHVHANVMSDVPGTWRILTFGTLRARQWLRMLRIACNPCPIHLCVRLSLSNSDD